MKIVIEVPEQEPIAAFYVKLLSKQEPLGKEFEQVLQDNFWELLVTTPNATEKAKPVTLTVQVNGIKDAQSFTRSRVQIEQSMARHLQHAAWRK